MSNELEIVSPAAAGVDEGGLQRFRDAIRRDMDNGLHHGATVLLARNGKVVLHEGLGLADTETHRPSRTTDRYWLASTSKAFTAAAVLKAIDKGLLTLDTRVCEIIPDFGVRGKQRVTLYHLLTHTGGTWASFMPPYPMRWGSEMADLSHVVAGISAQQLTHRPGDTVYYNPWADFTVLGEILRLVEGRRYRDVMKEEIFSPLGLEHTTCGLEIKHPDRVPVKMADLSPGAADTETMHSMNLLDETAERPAGGLFSTAADLFAFAEMFRLGGLGKTRLLSPALTDYALRNHTGNKPNVFWDFSKEARDVAEFPANFSLAGGYVRGEGHYLSPLGSYTSPRTFGAVGSGSTMWMVDPARGMTFVFLAAGLMEGLGHFQRLQRLSDMAVATLG